MLNGKNRHKNIYTGKKIKGARMFSQFKSVYT